jgi:hypothetical protein
MAVVAGFCVLLLVSTTVIHYEALRLMTAGLPKTGLRPRPQLILVMIGAFVAHALEIALYALAFYALTTWFAAGRMGDGKILTFAQVLYFSAETYTSLGYGDVLPHGDLRLLVGVEAVNGLLLIGWTTSYTYLAMERLWSEDNR